jgi:hypothetical protein
MITLEFRMAFLVGFIIPGRVYTIQEIGFAGRRIVCLWHRLREDHRDESSEYQLLFAPSGECPSILLRR